MGMHYLFNSDGPHPTLNSNVIQWKQYLTTAQIVQFVIILAGGVFVSECLSILSLSFLTSCIMVAYQYIAYEWFPQYLPHMGGCTLTPTMSIAGFGVITSYLVLFLDFFYKTYSRKTRLNGVPRHPKSTIASAEEPAFWLKNSRLVRCCVGSD